MCIRDRCFVAVWLFNQVSDSDYVAFRAAFIARFIYCCATVKVNRLFGYFHESNYCSTCFFVNSRHFSEKFVSTVDDVISEEYSERISVSVQLCNRYSVPQT